MTTMELADDLTGFCIKGCEKCSGSVAGVIMCPPFRLSWTHRKNWLLAIEGLNLRLLIDTHDERLVGWIKIQSDDIANLLDEQRILRQLERLRPMGLQCEGSPDSAYSSLAEPASLRHRSSAPMCGVLRFCLKRKTEDTFNISIGNLARGSGTGFVKQPIHAPREKALTPTADHLSCHSLFTSHLAVRMAGGTAQHDTRPLSQGLCCRRATRPSLKHLAIFACQNQGLLWASGAHTTFSFYNNYVDGTYLVPLFMTQDTSSAASRAKKVDSVASRRSWRNPSETCCSTV